LLRHLAEGRAHRPRSVPLGAAAEGLGTLSEWNRQLITYGSRVLAQRAQFFQELKPLLSAVHGRLSGLTEPFTIDYVAGVKIPAARRNQKFDGELEPINWGQLFAATLESDHEDDMRRGTTSSGPHRDDLVFKLGDVDLRRYGSQGQQRLAVLSLKVALAQWVAQATGEPPVLLLDDALSELDATRRAHLLEEAACFPQSVLTATDAKFVEDVPATLFSVNSGRVAPTAPSVLFTAPQVAAEA
jgi:DNA replication and repair protein RecF